MDLWTIQGQRSLQVNIDMVSHRGFPEDKVFKEGVLLTPLVLPCLHALLLHRPPNSPSSPQTSLLWIPHKAQGFYHRKLWSPWKVLTWGKEDLTRLFTTKLLLQSLITCLTSGLYTQPTPPHPPLSHLDLPSTPWKSHAPFHHRTFACSTSSPSSESMFPCFFPR